MKLRPPKAPTPALDALLKAVKPRCVAPATSLVTYPCKLFLGERGSGKTVSLLVEQLAIADDVSTFTFDWQGAHARAFLSHMSANGKEDRCLIDIARLADKTLRWPFCTQSNATNPFEREIQNRVAVQAFASLFFAKMNQKLGEETPWIYKYLIAAIRMWVSMPDTVPVWWIRQAFRINSPEYKHMIAKATDTDAVYVFEEARKRCASSPIQLEKETGGAARRVEILMSVILWARHGHDSLNFREIMLQKKHVIFDLSGIPLEEARALTIAAYTAIIAVQRIHHAETGKALPGVIVLEEMGALGTATPQLLDWMAEGRQKGGSVWGVTQTPRDMDEDSTQPVIFKRFASLCGEIHVHHLKSDVDLIAPFLAQPSFDSHKVHHTTTRIGPIGQEEVHRTSKTKGKDNDSITEGSQLVTKYGPVTDEHLYTPQLNTGEWEQKVSSYGIGEKGVRSMFGVREYVGENRVKHPGGPWPLGDTFLPNFGMTLTEKRTNEAIERIRSSSLYKVPVWIETPPPPDEEPKTPKNTPKPPGQKKPGAASNSGKKGKGRS